jgi:hypothetical protein
MQNFLPGIPGDFTTLFHVTQRICCHSYEPATHGQQTHAELYQLQDDDKYVRGAKETIIHILIHCPQLQELQQKLRSKNLRKILVKLFKLLI